MKGYLLLLRVNMKSLLRGVLTDTARKADGKMRISFVLLYALAAVGLLSAAGMVIAVETMLYHAVAGLGLERLLIGLALLLSMVVTLIFGVFHTMGAMYFNRDTAATAHLPISQRTQMLARWTEIYLSEILFSFLLLLPMIVNHGIAQGAGAVYYLKCMAVLLATPLYPLSIALLLASLLAQISAFSKHKEVWMVIGTLLLLAVVLGSEMLLMPRIPESANALFFISLLMDNEALLNFLIGVFPPVLWAVKAIGGDGMMLALFVGTGLAAVAAVVALTGGVFLKTCLKHTEHGVNRKGGRNGAISFEPARPLTAIFRREMNETLKTPVYLMNAVLGVLMMPIMLIAMSAGLASEGQNVSLLVDELLNLVSPLDLTLIFAAVFSVMLFVCTVPVTAISREGKRLPIARMIPVSPRVILWGKILPGLIIVGLGSVLMGVAFVLLLGLRVLPQVIAALVMVNMLSCSVSIGCITVDVLRPMLSWKSENEVMKQNMNAMFGMLIYVLLLAVIVVPVLLMLKQDAWMRMATAVLLLLLEVALSLVMMRRVAEPGFSRLEP